MADLRRLPAAVTAIWEWQMQAACRDMDSAVFFHPDNERGPAKDERDRQAKNVCALCPVVEPCRRHALAVQEPYGVWGGLTVGERTVILRHSGRIDLAPPRPAPTRPGPDRACPSLRGASGPNVL